jgi:hypothetical protein
MPDNENNKPENPPCEKCGEPTRFYFRLPDPKTSTPHDLYGCTACGEITSRHVEEK